MMYNPYDLQDGESGGGGYDGGYTDDGSGGYIGGTDPSQPPTHKPGPKGWWEFVAGAWRWITDPAPGTVRT